MAGLLNLAVSGHSQSMFNRNELTTQYSSCLSLTEVPIPVGRKNGDAIGKVVHIPVDSRLNPLSYDT
jgi:hypothetical protein